MFKMGNLIVLLSTYLKLKFKSDPVYDLAINPNEIYPGAFFYYENFIMRHDSNLFDADSCK